MNSDLIFGVIDKIAETPSKNEKELLIKAHAPDPAFKAVLLKAISPLITYGLAKRPSIPGAGTEQFSARTWELLNDLKDRVLTGNAAIEAVRAEMSALTADSAELLWRIISKDLKAGFGDNTVNKVIPGHIPEFPYMRCTLLSKVKVDKLPWAEGMFSQIKADGMFVNVNTLANGDVQLLSRQGSQFPLDAFGELIEDIKLCLDKDTQTHGELLVQRTDAVGREVRILAREISNGMLNSVLSGGTFEHGCKPVFLAWDQIPLVAVRAKGKWQEEYKIRYMNLAAQMLKQDSISRHVAMVETKIVNSLEEAMTHYRECLARGLEGTIIKSPKAIWKDGTSKDQIKLKLEVDVDLRIVGFEPGNGKNRLTFGSIICRTDDGSLEVCVSGFTDKQRQDIWADHMNYLDKIETVRANSVMFPSEPGKKHSLFLPRHVEFRTDKNNADSLQQVIDQFASAVRAA